MFKILFLTALASATLASGPNIQFTSDSVYTKNDIISCEVIEIQNAETGEISKDLIIQEKQLLGYSIYDNQETDYIDGLKIDGEWVTGWRVKNFDDSEDAVHTFQVKTVYTDDAAGMLMAAKDGDWSRLLSNPLILLQIFYYVLAAFSLLFGLIFGTKQKGKTIKTTNEFGAELNNIFSQKVGLLATNAEDAIIKYVDSLVMPVYNEMQAQNKDLLSALILSQSGDEKAHIAMIDLLKASASKDVNLISEQIKKGIRDANLQKELLKAQAENTIKELAESVKPAQVEEEDGTSI